MSGEATYFRDGYTRRCRIQQVDRLHGELRFELRPMLPASRDRLMRLGKTVEPDAYNTAICAAMEKHIVSWDCRDDLGRPVPIERGTIGRLQPMLYDKLFWVMIGNAPGDPLEEPAPDETEDYIRSLGGEDLAGIDEKNL